MLTISEAAERLEVGESTLRRRLRETFPTRRRGARIDPSDLPNLARATGLVMDLASRPEVSA